MKAIALMPFDKSFNNTYLTMVNACRECVDRGIVAELSCTRHDQEVKMSFDIMASLLEMIRECSFCIFDVTGGNQNVLWELGFASALEKDFIIVTQDDEVPFNISDKHYIQYSPGDLEALQRALVEVIAAEFNKPDLPGAEESLPLATFAEALLSSSGSPIYVLDADYKILFINEAAAEIFAPKFGNGSYWIGRTLREFMDSFSEDLVNLPAIEKNLQIQSEEIQWLIENGTPGAIPRSNVETIEFRSAKYGDIELQKTGVAVSRQDSDDVVGWVVSFNFKRAGEPDRFRKFHEFHELIIKTKLFKSDTGHIAQDPVDAKDMQRKDWPDNERIDAWIAGGCQAPVMEVAENYAQKQRCFDFCAAIMKSDKRYGLKSVKYLDEWFFDFNKAQFIVMREPASNEMVAVFRIHPNTTVAGYPDIASWAKEMELHANEGDEDEAFADVGAYIHPKIAGRQRSVVLAKLIGLGARIAEYKHQYHLYAQVPSRSHKDLFVNKFGWMVAGKDFRLDTWTQERWSPIAQKCFFYSDLSEATDEEIARCIAEERVGVMSIDREDEKEAEIKRIIGAIEETVDYDFIREAARTFQIPPEHLGRLV